MICLWGSGEHAGSVAASGGAVDQTYLVDSSCLRHPRGSRRRRYPYPGSGTRPSGCEAARAAVATVHCRCPRGVTPGLLETRGSPAAEMTCCWGGGGYACAQPQAMSLSGWCRSRQLGDGTAYAERQSWRWRPGSEATRRLEIQFCGMGTIWVNRSPRVRVCIRLAWPRGR